MKKYRVELTPKQREKLSRMISAGKVAARELTPAHTLLKAEQGPQGPGWSDSRISVTINWRFTAEDASITLKHPYPSVTD